jgi:hypothetical protein
MSANPFSQNADEIRHVMGLCRNRPPPGRSSSHNRTRPEVAMILIGGGRFDTEGLEPTFAGTGVGDSPAHAPIRLRHVIAIGQPLLPVAPLIGAGVKQ